MRALIFGGSGTVGANLVRRLLADECDVTVASRKAVHAIRLAGLDAVTKLNVDCQDAEAVAAVVSIAKPDAVFHLVSSRFGSPETTAQDHLAINTLGTLNVLEAARRHDVPRVVLSGSAAEYGSGTRFSEAQTPQPANLYGATKLCGSLLGETYARDGLSVINLRLFTPYGPWERAQRLIPSVILSALADRPVTIGDGAPERDFVFLEDVADALIAAAAHDAVGTFNVASGEGISVRTTAETILELMQSRVPIESTGTTRKDEISKMSGDAEAIRRALGWRPRHDFRAGLEKTIAWFSTHAALAPQLD